VSQPPALRASDADRERTIALLRDHAAEGRLTLEEFTDRMSAAYLARTNDELEELARDLPSTFAPVVSRRRPTRFLFSLLGSTERDGRIRVRRRVGCLMGFGNIDLDLHGFALGGHKRARGNDPLPRPGTPLVRVFAVSIFAGIDVWRVPIAWTQRTWRQVIRGIRSGAHKELEA
jgi:hypothetical protein